MGNSRFTTFALGRVNNFAARSDGVFIDDTTPDVSNGSVFYFNNSAATVVTDLELSGFNAASEAEGKFITLIHLDSGTSYTKSATLQIAGSTGTYAAEQDSVLTLFYHNSAWFDYASPTTAVGGTVDSPIGEVRTYTIAGTSAIDVQNVSVAVIHGTAATSIHQFLNGRAGQVLFLHTDTGGIRLTISNSSQNIFIADTQSFVTSFSGGYSFVNRDGTVWSMVGGTQT